MTDLNLFLSVNLTPKKKVFFVVWGGTARNKKKQLKKRGIPIATN